MAVRTYLYRPKRLAVKDLSPLLAGGASPVVGNPTPNSLVPVTIDDSHKEDLDDAMGQFGYEYIEEYTGGSTLGSRNDFGALAADPSGITVAEGDRYYNSTLNMDMKYDSVRAKWLSVATTEFQFGRNGNTQDGSYYRTTDGRVLSSTLGWRATSNGTVVALAYTRADTDAATFQVTADGTTVASLASTSLTGQDSTFNSNFNSTAILGVRNALGGNTTTNVVGWVQVRWRA